MANPGVGLRTVCDVLCEISYHLLENVVQAVCTNFAAGPIITVSNQTAMYDGAQVVVGWGLSNAEVVTITSVNGGGTINTTALVNSHNPGETILAPTFPSQVPVDEFFTQAQMIEWISRANNELLSQVPVAYLVSYQNLLYGQVFQNTPSNCIEINRVAASTYYCALTSLTRTNDEVVAVAQSPHGLAKGSTIFVQNATAGFGGVFEVDTIISPTSFSYPQTAADGSATGGAILYFSRIYETTQAEITMTDRTWRNDFVPTPGAWFEDRSGLYRWGVNGRPSSNYPVELLCSIRDSDTLTLLDGFLVPDTLVYLIKHKVLAYALGSENEQSDPARAAYCEQRFQRGVAAIRRYLEGFQLNPQGQSNG